jgi:Ca-activated chloride channel family protein
MSSIREWKLSELAESCGVAPRTVRYYVQRGLLPAPAFRGKDTAYGEEHRLRLLAIKKLQEQFWSLDAIERELEGKSTDALRKLSSETRSPPVPLPVSLPLPSPIAPEPREGGAGTSYARVMLAPGLELHVQEGARAEVQQLAIDIQNWVRKTGGWK